MTGTVLSALVRAVVVGCVILVLSLLVSSAAPVLGQLVLLGGAGLMMIRPYRKPWPLAWGTLLPPIGMAVVSVGLQLGLPGRDVTALLPWPGLVGLVIGLAMGSRRSISTRGETLETAGAAGVMSIWVVSYVLTQAISLLGLVDAAGLGKLVSMFATALLCGFYLGLLLRYVTLRGKGRRRPLGRARAVMLGVGFVLFVVSSAHADSARELGPRLIGPSDFGGTMRVEPALTRTYEDSWRENVQGPRPRDYYYFYTHGNLARGVPPTRIEVIIARDPALAREAARSMARLPEAAQPVPGVGDQAVLVPSAPYDFKLKYPAIGLAQRGNWVVRVAVEVDPRTLEARDVQRSLGLQSAEALRVLRIVDGRIARALGQTAPTGADQVPPGTTSSDTDAFVHDVDSLLGDIFGNTSQPLSDAAQTTGLIAGILQLLAGAGLAAATAAAVAAAGATATATATAVAAAAAATGATVTIRTPLTGTNEIRSGAQAWDWLRQRDFITDEGKFTDKYTGWSGALPSEANPTSLLSTMYGSDQDADQFTHPATGLDRDDDTLHIVVSDPSMPAEPAPPEPAEPEPEVPEQEPPESAEPEPQPFGIEAWCERQRRLLIGLRGRNATLKRGIGYLQEELAKLETQHQNACWNGVKNGVWSTAFFAATNLNVAGRLGRLGSFLARWQKLGKTPAGKFWRYIAENMIDTAVRKGVKLSDGQRQSILDDAKTIGEAGVSKAATEQAVKSGVKRLGQSMLNQAGGDAILRSCGEGVKGLGKGAGGLAASLFDVKAWYDNWSKDADHAASLRRRISETQRELSALKSELETNQQDLEVEESVFKGQCF